jgi:hypothetical protein
MPPRAVPSPSSLAHDLESLARRYRLPVADLTIATAHAVSLVPERWARRFHVVPLSATEHELVVATADPLDVECERSLAFATGRHVRLALANVDQIARRIDELYTSENGAVEPEAIIEIQHLRAGDESAPPTPGEETTGSVTTLVDELLAAGIAARASDIHIEPEERGIAVRHRIDGALAVTRTLPRSLGPALVSRIKILSGLDIADRLRPQDGRARVAINGVAVDLRVSTLPASHGEKVVVRVLDARSTVMTLDGMGFHADELSHIERLLEAREGLILVTGPTGSGKTTTLYAALRRVKERGVNIVTVEDPIEYRLPGIVQVQVNEKAGLTFATALRSIMRQDPDVVLIGEIRDRETAEIAIQASSVNSDVRHSDGNLTGQRLDSADLRPPPCRTWDNERAPQQAPSRRVRPQLITMFAAQTRSVESGLFVTRTLRLRSPRTCLEANQHTGESPDDTQTRHAAQPQTCHPRLPAQASTDWPVARRPSTDLLRLSRENWRVSA